MDKLAFDVLYELRHIEKHLSKEQKTFISIESTLYTTNPRERETNGFTRMQLITNDIWAKILRVGSIRFSPHKTVRSIAQRVGNRGIGSSIAIS